MECQNGFQAVPVNQSAIDEIYHRMVQDEAKMIPHDCFDVEVLRDPSCQTVEVIQYADGILLVDTGVSVILAFF